MKVEVGVISRSLRLRLITLTQTLIILDITKTELITVLLHIERKKKWKSPKAIVTTGAPPFF